THGRPGGRSNQGTHGRPYRRTHRRANRGTVRLDPAGLMVATMAGTAVPAAGRRRPVITVGMPAVGASPVSAPSQGVTRQNRESPPARHHAHQELAHGKLLCCLAILVRGLMNLRLTSLSPGGSRKDNWTGNLKKAIWRGPSQ